MKLDLKNKKLIVIAAAVGIAVLTLSVGLGVGLGTSGDTTSTGDYYSDPILEKLRDKEDLLANGINWNGEKIEVTEENNKLYATIKQGTRLELSPPEFYDTKFEITKHMGEIIIHKL